MRYARPWIARLSGGCEAELTGAQLAAKRSIAAVIRAMSVKGVGAGMAPTNSMPAY